MNQSVPPDSRLLTAEDLLALPDDGRHRYELVAGRLVVAEPPNLEHGTIAARIAGRLLAFVEPRQLGVVAVETGCVVQRGPDTVRGPDVTFLSAERVPAPDRRRAFVEGAPDLVVEIVSPGDRAGELARKVAGYFAAGARLVWVVYPERSLVVVHTPDGAKQLVRAPDALDGAAVLPGFTLAVADLFTRW